MIDVLWIFALLIVLVFLGLPIFVSFIITSLAAVLVLGIPLSVIPVKTFGGIDSFSLMAIPFFILAGNIMMESEITEKIVNFANALVGRLKGGLGHVSIVSSMIFAGIQGSGVADASAIGSIMIPSMVKQGYGKDYAVGDHRLRGDHRPHHPAEHRDDHVRVLHGAFGGETVPRRIRAGGPDRRRAHDRQRHPVPPQKVRFRTPPQNVQRDSCVTTYQSIGALIMPMIIVFGIVGGVFTPDRIGDRRRRVRPLVRASDLEKAHAEKAGQVPSSTRRTRRPGS